MVDVSQRETLYRLHDSYSQVATELYISRNTEKKYLHKIDRSSWRYSNWYTTQDPYYPITQANNYGWENPAEVHQYLKENKNRPRKQRINGKQIYKRVNQSGHKICYTTLKRIIQREIQTQKTCEIFIRQSPEPGCRAEFDCGELSLNIQGVRVRIYL